MNERVRSPPVARVLREVDPHSAPCNRNEPRKPELVLPLLVKSELLLRSKARASVLDPSDGNDFFVHLHGLYETARPGGTLPRVGEYLGKQPDSRTELFQARARTVKGQAVSSTASGGYVKRSAPVSLIADGYRSRSGP
jgi:hypothetical protein